jgi:hypothetical protein
LHALNSAGEIEQRGALRGGLHERYRFGTALSPLREREQKQRGGHSCNDGT